MLGRRRDLTDRQRLVLELVAGGHGTKAIAAKMGISEPGVRKHLESLRRRFRVANRAELVGRAYDSGELTPKRNPQTNTDVR